ncbi:MAG: sensor histidine kinase [Bacteroidota bacterium]
MQNKPAKAQDGVSEKSQITISAKPDTGFIKILLDKAIQLREKFPDSAFVMFREVLSQSKMIGYRDGIAEAFRNIGRYYSSKNDHEKSLYFLRSALPYCSDDMRGYEKTVSLYLAISVNYYYEGRYDSCAWYRYQALNYLQEHNIQNLDVQIDVYGRLLQFWLNAHKDIQNDPYSRELAAHIDRFEKQALATNDSSVLMEVYFQKAGYYNNLKKNDSARYYCHRTLEIGSLLNMSNGVRMSTLVNIGITYVEDKQPELAMEYFHQLKAYANEHNVHNRYEIFADIMMGEAYCMQKKYDSAIAITLPALARAESMKIITTTDNAHKNLADAYDALGQYEMASIHRKQYSEIRDSLNKAEKMEVIYDLEMKYQITEKDKQIAEKELAIAQNESRIKTKNTWIIGITAGLVLLVLVSLLVYRNNVHKQKIQREKIQNMQRESEIGRLKGVISGEEKERSRIARELHDGMGGTLGSIRGQLSMIFRKHKTTDVSADFLEIMKLLEEAAADLRHTSHNLMPEILLQEGLAKATALFCERVRKAGATPVSFETWGEAKKMPPDFELSVYRIIQELVQNIIKHAQATEASVQLVFHDTQLCLTVEDNGKGIDTSEKRDGMGLTTVRERVHSLSGVLDIDSTPGKGTSVYIEFNLP